MAKGNPFAKGGDKSGKPPMAKLGKGVATPPGNKAPPFFKKGGRAK